MMLSKLATFPYREAFPRNIESHNRQPKSFQMVQFSEIEKNVLPFLFSIFGAESKFAVKIYIDKFDT